MGTQNLISPSSNDSIAEQAAEWIVRLTADDPIEQKNARAGFDAWRQADPRHADAAEHMQSFIGQVQSVAGNAKSAHVALSAAFSMNRKQGRVKRAGAALALAFALGMPAWLALQVYPPSYLMADMRTAIGKWETQTLSDGTRITLNSASAVNLRFDTQRRALDLVRGEVLVDVAPDAARPFLVETTHGSIRALGTRFVVSREDESTVLTMLESKVSVQTAEQRSAHDDEGMVVSAGQRLRIRTNGVSPIEEVDVDSVSSAWKNHQLVVHDKPLPEVLDELNRHRPGRIQYKRAELQNIKVSAVLPLDDTDRALQLLLTNFDDLRIRMITPYLVLVDMPVKQ